jgi:hypothetical protein
MCAMPFPISPLDRASGKAAGRSPMKPKRRSAARTLASIMVAKPPRAAGHPRPGARHPGSAAARRLFAEVLWLIGRLRAPAAPA